MGGLTIHEVGPRDGLQNLRYLPKTEEKITLIDLLIEAGLKSIEIGSFVNPHWVPNMADSGEVFSVVNTSKPADVELSVLTPNKRGVDRAKEVGATNFGVFFSPNDDFNQANYNSDLDTILERYRTALEDIDRGQVRVYISMAFGGCVEDLQNAIKAGLDFGDKIVLCDTTGEATPFDVALALDYAMDLTKDIALHLHHGKHLFDNIETAFLHGVREFDASIGGLGGCPFIPRSGANLATEDLVAWCQDRGIDCGVDYAALGPAIEVAYRIKNPHRRAAIGNKLRQIKGRVMGAVRR